GVGDWRRGRLRIAVAFLLAFCLLVPAGWLITLVANGILAQPATPERWELYKKLGLLGRFANLRAVTNDQIWWSLLLAMPAYVALRRFTRSTVFSLVFAVMLALLSFASLLRMGLLELLDENTGRAFLLLMPIAALYFAAAFIAERLGHPAD